MQNTHPEPEVLGVPPSRPRYLVVSRSNDRWTNEIAKHAQDSRVHVFNGHAELSKCVLQSPPQAVVFVMPAEGGCIVFAGDGVFPKGLQVVRDAQVATGAAHPSHFSAERGGEERERETPSQRSCTTTLQDKVFVVFYRTQRTLPRFRLPVIVENQQPLQLLPSCNVVLWTKPQDAAAFFNNLHKKASEPRAKCADSALGGEKEAPLPTVTKQGERSRCLGWIAECKRGIRLWFLLLIVCACGLGTYGVWRLSILWRRQYK